MSSGGTDKVHECQIKKKIIAKNMAQEIARIAAIVSKK
jgi:hypothetical protein